MARNVELKARDPDPGRSLEISLALGAEDHGWLQQLDTYFRAPQERLKLREQGNIAELIYYERFDEAIERESNYRIICIEDPEALMDALAAALGVLISVEKSRQLLLWHDVRIHLDEVPGLGSFIELETVAPPGPICPTSTDWSSSSARRSASLPSGSAPDDTRLWAHRPRRFRAGSSSSYFGHVVVMQENRSFRSLLRALPRRGGDRLHGHRRQRTQARHARAPVAHAGYG
jgi:adenylate cyclase class IV